MSNLYQYNKQSGYYLISNTLDSRVYVGLATNLYKRIGGHKSDLKNNRHGNGKLQNFVNKYGFDKLVFEVIELSKELSIDREIELMDHYDSLINGFNIVRDTREMDHIDRKLLYADGSKKKGIPLTEEVRQNIINGVRRYHELNPNQSRNSKPWSEERKEKYGSKKIKQIPAQRIIINGIETWKRVGNKINHAKGQLHHNCKLTEEIVKSILLDIKERIKRKDIVAKYNISVSIYKDIQSRKSWKHITI